MQLFQARLEATSPASLTFATAGPVGEVGCALKQSDHPALSEFVQSMGPELMANRGSRNLDVKATV